MVGRMIVTELLIFGELSSVVIWEDGGEAE